MTGYLPLPCPICNRLRIEYRTEGDRMDLKCEKCGADRDVIFREYERLVDAAHAETRDPADNPPESQPRALYGHLGACVPGHWNPDCPACRIGMRLQYHLPENICHRHFDRDCGLLSGHDGPPERRGLTH